MEEACGQEHGEMSFPNGSVCGLQNMQQLHLQQTLAVAWPTVVLMVSKIHSLGKFSGAGFSRSLGNS